MDEKELVTSLKNIEKLLRKKTIWDEPTQNRIITGVNEILEIKHILEGNKIRPGIYAEIEKMKDSLRGLPEIIEIIKEFPDFKTKVVKLYFFIFGADDKGGLSKEWNDHKIEHKKAPERKKANVYATVVLIIGVSTFVLNTILQLILKLLKII